MQVIVRHRIQHQRYDILITKIVKVSVPNYNLPESWLKFIDTVCTLLF